MNKLFYLGILILKFNKMVMWKSWHDYVKRKYGEKWNLCHMATDTITVYKKSQENYSDIAKYIETRIEQQYMN